MITAEEFLNKDYFYIILDIRESPINPTDISRAMIEFAKLHTEQALKEASENVIINGHPFEYELDKNSILNAYSLENIK